MALVALTDNLLSLARSVEKTLHRFTNELQKINAPIEVLEAARNFKSGLKTVLGYVRENAATLFPKHTFRGKRLGSLTGFLPALNHTARVIKRFKELINGYTRQMDADFNKSLDDFCQDIEVLTS